LFEEHLLLNRDSADSDGDGLDDGRDPVPNVRNASLPRDNDYIRKSFDIFSVWAKERSSSQSTETLIQVVLFQGTTRARTSTTRPLLVEGNPEDFAAVRLPVPVFVYSGAESSDYKPTAPTSMGSL